MTIVMSGKILHTGPLSKADNKFLSAMAYAISKWKAEGKPQSGRDMS